MVREFLPNNHGDIFECADGAAAVQCFESHHPDWILMDIDMPVMDGLEATRLIRQGDPAARVIIVTALPNEDLRDAALSAGATHFLPKEDLRSLRALIATPTK